MSATPVTYTAEFAAESRNSVIVGVLTTFFVIALIVVILRIYVRGFVTHSFGADDVLMIIAMVCFVSSPQMSLLRSFTLRLLTQHSFVNSEGG